MALPPRQLVPNHSGGIKCNLKPPADKIDASKCAPEAPPARQPISLHAGPRKKWTPPTPTTTPIPPKLRAHASTSVTLGPSVAWMEGASGGLSLLQTGCNAATLRRGGSDVSLPDAIHDESQRCTHACQPRILPLLFPLPPTLFPLNGAWTALQGQHAHAHAHAHICTRATPCWVVSRDRGHVLTGP
jgi:hypothetical protein